jgi:phage terminase large subunit-like protein
MGLRGIGGRPVKRPEERDESAAAIPHPWDAPGLSRAERLISFIESMPLTAGQWAGQTFKLRPWQRRELEKIYRSDADGKRIVRRVCWSMARGNGKTGLAAVVALAHFCGPEAEERGEIYACACDKFQASRLFHEIVAVIERVDWLRDRISIRRHEKVLEDRGGTGSIFAALSADVPTKMGLSPTFVCMDELGSMHSRALLDAMESALGKRRDAMLWTISTQAATDSMPMSEMIDYGLKVKRGEINDPSFHLVLYTAEPEDDPWSQTTWRKANPGLDDILALDHVKRMAKQAKALPSAEASFRNLYLNQRISSSDTFISPATWKACGDPVDLEALKRVKCHAGLDLSTAQDLTAFAIVGDVNGKAHAHVIHWLPRDGLHERSIRDRHPYDTWARQGLLELTPGPTIDYDYLAGYLRDRVFAQFNIEKIAYDPYNWTFFKAALLRAGVTQQFIDAHFVDFRQGFITMSPAITALEAKLLEKKISHGNHPVLSMCAAQAIVLHDGTGNRKFDKDGYLGRIDGLVALTMAIGVTPIPPTRIIDIETLIG